MYNYLQISQRLVLLHCVTLHSDSFWQLVSGDSSPSVLKLEALFELILLTIKLIDPKVIIKLEFVVTDHYVPVASGKSVSIS